MKLTESHGFEEALACTKFGKFNYILIALSGALLATSFIELTSINLVLAISQCELSLTNIDKGVLSSIGYVGIILSSHLWGFLADTRGRKAVLVPTLLMAFLCTLATSIAKPFWLITLLRFLNGFW